MKTEYPDAAAERVAACAREVGEALSAWCVLGRSPDDVSPQPCDAVDHTVEVRGRGRSAVGDWIVDYSPYVVLYIDHADVESEQAMDRALVQMRERLVAGGWTLVGGDDELLIEAPGGGYGARIGRFVTRGGRARITVTVASPCLRHPDAIDDPVGGRA